MTADSKKTKQQLIDELTHTRQRIAALETPDKSRLKTEQALIESERKTRAILDQTFQFIGLMKPDGTLIDANRSSLEFGGLRSVDVIDRFFWETPWWSHSVELQEKIKAGIEKAAAGEFIRLEVYHPAPDGGVSYVDASLKPVLNECGEVVYIIPEGRDITERKRAEEEVQKLALAIEHSGELVNMAALDGQMIFLNPAGREMLGIDPDEVTNTNIMQVIPKHLYELVNDDLLPTLKNGQTWRGDLQYLNLKSGKLRDVHAVTYSVPDPRTGAPLFLANVSMDITEQKQAEKERRALRAQVQHMQKLESLGVLAGGIAHDFNNLLTGIMGNSELALVRLSPHSSIRENIEGIQKAAVRAANLCNQMLAYSGKGRFVSEVFDPARVVEETAQMLQASISKKVSLTFDFKRDTKPIEADRDQITQVILNLITNASEAIGDASGVIAVRIGTMLCDRAELSGGFIDEELPAGEYTCIEVTDTGAGMCSDTLSKIFDPFFTTKFTGRGLGLSAVLGIIRGHRAAITVSSEQGKGACFKLFFPAVNKKTDQPIKAPMPLPRWRGQGTILLVDDEDIVRETGAAMLESTGFQTLTASDGVEALTVFQGNRNQIDLILLDLTMPRMDGVETLAHLRKADSNIPIIVCSGYNETDVSEQFSGQELVSFLQKPFLLEELISKLKKVLE